HTRRDRGRCVRLVDISDREDLIATGKIKPAPEFVEVDGKMVRTSPEEYRNVDNCKKVDELMFYRKNIFLLTRYDKFRMAYELKTKENNLFQIILLNDRNCIRITGCFSDSCLSPDFENEIKYVLLKNTYGNDMAGKISLMKNYSNLEGFTEEKYLFMKTKNCKVTFYKGSDF
ncbi:MAG: hypothetical protein RQ866_07420, partial [Bacteroidales bacterium]|nr:hypothetical protein [Bacteroidales bacterium]